MLLKDQTFHMGEMRMELIDTRSKLCPACMKIHDVSIVNLEERAEFKGQSVTFVATYEYCQLADEYIETEELIKQNDLTMKNAYRKQNDLLTSEEIVAIRERYDVSQKDFSEILDWGGATITRYENHHVQDRVHDDVLCKLATDPNWFIQLLNRKKGQIPDKAFLKYLQKARAAYQQQKNEYLKDTIRALYSNMTGLETTGGVELDLDKVVAMVNYLAAGVDRLFKVKLMKLLWYSDILHFKRHGRGISGLAYRALPLGAVPYGHEEILQMDGIVFEERIFGENLAYQFMPKPGFKVDELTQTEIQVMNDIMRELGKLKSDTIVKRMHEEDAYRCTNKNSIILYSYAQNLSLQ